MKDCYGKCDRCVWRDNGGCSIWNGWEGNTEAEYIEREAALDCFKCDLGKRDYSISYQGAMVEAAFRIIDIPAADVAPVVHGRWEESSDEDGTVCSVCGEDFWSGCFVTPWNYCPNCGAKMEAET